MSDATEKILADLPTIRQIARRPQSQNPLLAIILSQAQALSEIDAWTQNAEAVLKEADAEAPKRAALKPVPVVPNGVAHPS